MIRTTKAAMFVLAFAGMALADSGRVAAGPDFKSLDVAKAMARESFKGIAVYCVLGQDGGS